MTCLPPWGVTLDALYPGAFRIAARVHRPPLRQHVPARHHNHLAIRSPHQDVPWARPVATAENNALFSAPPRIWQAVFLSVVQAIPQSDSLPPPEKSKESCSSCCSLALASSSARRAAASFLKSSAAGCSFSRSRRTTAGWNVGRTLFLFLSNHCPCTRVILACGSTKVCVARAPRRTYPGPYQLDLLKQVGAAGPCLPGRRQPVFRRPAFTKFVMYTSTREKPAQASSRFRSLPAALTKGRLCRSSSALGASLTNITAALGSPSPNTTCRHPVQRPQAQQARQRASGSLSGPNTVRPPRPNPFFGRSFSLYKAKHLLALSLGTHCASYKAKP